MNTHLGIEQSRRDDLECLGYTMIYLAKGILPWQGIKLADKSMKYEKILERKKGISMELLCKDLPPVFAHFLQYVRSLRFDDRPDYGQIKKWFWDQFSKDRMNVHFEYDWNKLNINLDTYFERTTSTNGSAKAGAEKKPNEDQKQQSPRPKGQPGETMIQKLILKKFSIPPQDQLRRQCTAPNIRPRNSQKEEQKPEPVPSMFINNTIKKIRAEFLKGKEGSSNYDSDEMDECASIH